MNSKLESILNYIKINKKSKIINKVLNIDAFYEIEKNRSRFYYEVGKILGICKIEIIKISNKHRLLKIEKVEDYFLRRKYGIYTKNSF